MLVTPNGGLPEVVRDLSSDLVLPSAEPADLAEGIGRALSGATPLPDGDACQRYARDRFSWRHVAEQTRAVYEEVLR